jgi:hypothetical protein
LLIITTAYFSNLFAVSHIEFTKNASAEFQLLQAPEYATVHTNYILLSNLYVMLLLNFGISTLLMLLAIMMILQGIVNKFAVPKLAMGYKPLVWLGLIGFVVIFVLLMITQYFVQYYFS